MTPLALTIDEVDVLRRLREMCREAGRKNKFVPPMDDLVHIFKETGMVCPHCKKQMNLRASDGWKSTITLQHNRSGSVGFLCHSCNVAHRWHDGDSFYNIPADHKICKYCNRLLPRTAYSSRKVKGGTKPYHICRECRPRVNAYYEKRAGERKS